MVEGDTTLWTHEVDGVVRPHEWMYLGKTLQRYRCRICLQGTSKADLKAATDA